MNRILLAYCHENANLAQTIERKIGRLGLPFEHLSDRPNDAPGQFAEKLARTDAGVVLILTDNLLKSRFCMHNMRAALQRLLRLQVVQIVLADGRYPTEDGTGFTLVETHIERMVHALQYLNYWQSAWLEQSNRFEHASPSEQSVLRTDMQEVHDIANEVGEVIGMIRENGYITWQQFEQDDYMAFFRQFGLQQWHEQYRRLAAYDYTNPPLETDRPAQTVHTPPPTTEPAAPEAVRSAAQEMEWDVIPKKETGHPDAEEIDSELEQTVRDAWFWLENGHVQRGLNLFALAVEQYPNRSDLREQYEQANQRFGQPSNPVSQPVAPTPLAPPAAAETDQPEVQTYLQLGEEAADKGDFLFAKFCWDRVAELNPNHPGIYRKLGLLTSEHLRDYKETAVHYLRRAIEQEPQDAQLHYRLADVLYRQFDDLRSALFHLDQATTLDPDFAHAWFDLAQISLRTGHRDQAAQFYRQAVDLDPSLRSAEYDQAFLPLNTQPTAPANVTDFPAPEPPQSMPEPEAVPELQAPELSVQPDPETEAVNELKETNALPPLSIDGLVLQPFATLPKLDEENTSDLPPSDFDDEDTPHFPLPAISGDTPEDAPAVEEPPAAEPQFQPEAPALQPVDVPVATVDSTLLDFDAGQVNAFFENQNEEAALTPLQPEIPVSAPIALPVPEREILTILITGATSGIGMATAMCFARHGHRLILTGRRDDRLQDLKIAFERDFKVDVLTLNFDVRDFEAVKAAFDSRDERWQDVDVLINNAGLAKGLAPIHEGELEHWETMIDTNVKGLLYVTRAISPAMVARKRGHIINVGSTAGKEVYPNGNVYSATKFAVDALTRSMRLDLYQHGIRVSEVSPGHVEDTEFALNRFDGDAQRARIYEDFKPLNANDVAEVIYFIATRPAHVNIQDVWVFSTQQASATMIDRSGRMDRGVEEEFG